MKRVKHLLPCKQDCELEKLMAQDDLITLSYLKFIFKSLPKCSKKVLKHIYPSITAIEQSCINSMFIFLCKLF